MTTTYNSGIRVKENKLREICNLGYVITVLVFLLSLSSCRDSKTGSSYDCVNTDHSSYTTIEHGGVTREYILYIPSSYDNSIPSPLVINFHGYGGCAKEHLDYAGDLNSIADNENFIIAYPQAVATTKDDVSWNPEDHGIQNIQENDVYFTEQLISAISSDYTVDSSRIYSVGYSNGGMMSYGLACSRPDMIAAIGIMSGIMLPQACNTNEYTSVIHFHGIDDNVLPYDGNQDYQSISEVLDFWLDQNNIPESSLVSTQLNNSDVQRDEYTGGLENTSVVLYTINNEYGEPGGHVWFQDQIDGVSPNQLLWDFLSNYSL